MEQVRVFQEKLKYECRNQDYGYIFAERMMEIILILFMMITIDSKDMSENITICLEPIIFMGLALQCRIMPLTLIREKKSSVYMRGEASILEKLKYIPINRKQLIKWRQDILVKYCIKLTLICILTQVVVASIAMKQVALWNILYPLGVGMVQMFIGSVLIRY